jgi:calcium binding protein 39
MLRECARYEALAKIMLYADDFFNFFRYVEVSTFDIASDAFSTFKVCTYIRTYDITK